MSLEQAINDFRNCKLQEGSEPGFAPECQECPLNKPVHEYEEHPTFCEHLWIVNEQYSAYPESQHSMAPH